MTGHQMFHGMTCSKELIDSFHKLGMGIRYSNALILQDALTLHDLDRCSMCPDAMAEGRDSQVSVLSIMTKLSTLLALTALTCWINAELQFHSILGRHHSLSAYAVLRDSGYSIYQWAHCRWHRYIYDTILFLHMLYCEILATVYTSGPIVADTDTYMAASAISQKPPGLLCIKRKQLPLLYQCQGNFHTLRAVVVPQHSCHTPRVYPRHRTLSWHDIQLQSAISSGTRLRHKIVSNWGAVWDHLPCYLWRQDE